MRRERWRGPDGFLKPGTKLKIEDIERLDTDVPTCRDPECDHTLAKYGRLTVVGGIYGVAYWICRCDCGNFIVKQRSRVMGRPNPSCGEHRAEQCGNKFRTHGLSNHPLYGIWCHIKERCENLTCQAYENYGGRGIYVADVWKHDASAFIEWAESHGYRKGLELDRKDNDGPYSPENCRWVRRKVNANNKRSNIVLSIKGRSFTLAQAVRRFGKVSYAVAYDRHRKGRSVREILGRG